MAAGTQQAHPGVNAALPHRYKTGAAQHQRLSHTQEQAHAGFVGTEVSGQTPQNCDRMLAVLEPQIRQSAGFVMHAAGASGATRKAMSATNAAS